MNKLLLLFCLIYSLSLSAQKIHFTDPSNQWQGTCIVWNYIHSTRYIGYQWYDPNRYAADTFFDNKTYKHLQNGFYVREDTIAKKVFYRYQPDSSEKVLLDYNLQVGDTFNFGFYMSSVVSIDSTLINNVWHKVWHFARGWHGEQPLYIIEGIGTSYGPTYFTYPWARDDVESLYCFSNSGIFQSSGMPNLQISNGCSPLAVEELKPYVNDIILYPVPTTGALFIESPEKITGITISNLLGQAMFSKTFDDKKAEIDIESFSAGIYFITVNKTITRKFIKK